MTSAVRRCVPVLLLVSLVLSVLAAVPSPAAAAGPPDCAKNPSYLVDCAYYSNFYDGGAPDAGYRVAGTTSASPKDVHPGDTMTVTAVNHLIPYWDALKSEGMGSASLGAIPGSTIISYSPHTSATINVKDLGQGAFQWSAVETGTAGTCHSQDYTLPCDGTPTGEFPEGQTFSITFKVGDGGGDGTFGLGSSWGSSGGSGLSISRVQTHMDATPPVAALREDTTGNPNEFTFDGAPSLATVDGATISSYVWDFGDGLHATTYAPTTSVVHRYTAEGNRTVRLTVTDSGGRTGTTTVTLKPEIQVRQVLFDPAQVRPHTSFGTAVTVQNTGTSTVRAVGASVTSSTPAVVALTGSAAPASVDLAPGKTQVFSVPSAAGDDGQAVLTVDAAGHTAAGAAVSATQRRRNITVGNPGILVDIRGERAVVGDDVGVRVTLTNPGVDPITNLSFSDDTGVSLETVGSGTGPLSRVTSVAPTLPTELAPGHPIALTYLLHADGNGSAVLTTDLSGVTKAADGSDKDVTGNVALSVTVLSRVAAAADVRQATMLALDDAGQQMAGSRATIADLLASEVQTQLNLPTPTDAQIEAARTLGLPPGMAAMVSDPHGINAFGYGFSQTVNAHVTADATTLGRGFYSLAVKASDPKVWSAAGSRAYDDLQALPASTLQALQASGTNGGYLLHAVGASLTPSGATAGLQDTLHAGAEMSSSLHNGLDNVAHAITDKVLTLRSEAKTNRDAYLQDVGGLLGGGVYDVGKLGVSLAVGDKVIRAVGTGVVAVAGRLGLRSMETVAAGTDAAVATDVATDGTAVVAATDAVGGRLASLDGAVSAFQQRAVGSYLTLDEAAAEAGILPSDATKIQKIITYVKDTYGLDLDIGVRTSEPLSVGLDVSPKPELIKPKAVSILDRLLGAPESASGTATVYKPIPLSAEQVAANERLAPGFTQAYTARLEAQTKLYKEYQSASSSLRVLIDGSTKVGENGALVFPDGVTAIAGRPTELGSFTVPGNLRYVEQLRDPAFQAANNITSDYAAGLEQQLRSSYPDLTKVKIQVIDRGDGAVSFFDGIKGRPYGSDLDVQYVRPANGAPWPSGLRGKIETDINTQFKKLSRFPGHGYSDGANDLSTQFFEAAGKFLMSEGDPALAPAKAASLFQRFQLAGRVLDTQAGILEQQAAAATDSSLKALLNAKAAAFRAQAAKFRELTVQDILDYGSGSKLVRFTAGDIRVGYTPHLRARALVSLPGRTYVVTTTSDAAAADNGSCQTGQACSLREALTEASERQEPVTVQVPAGHYVLSAGTLQVAGAVSILGAGAASTVIDAAGASGVFDTVGGSLSVSGVTLTGGLLGDPLDGDGPGGGAALHAEGTAVSLTDDVVSNNASDGDGGGVQVLAGGSLAAAGSTFTSNFAAEGGALAVADSALSLSGCTFTSNGASTDGGAVAVRQAPRVTIASSAFDGNQALRHGGAVFIAGSSGSAPTEAISASTFTGNLAGLSGGAVQVQEPVTDQAGQVTLQLTSGTFVDNSAGSGGALASDDVPVQLHGTGFTGNSATQDAGGAVLTSGALLADSGSFRSNSANGSGGAIAAGGPATLSHLTVAGNAAGGLGGGLALLGGGLDTVESSSFSANRDDGADHAAGIWRDGGRLGTVGVIGAPVVRTASGTTTDGTVLDGLPAGRPTVSTFVSVTPVRLLDTRSGLGAAKRRVGPGGLIDLNVLGGRSRVPDDATAVVLNVAAVRPTSSSDVRVYPKPATGSLVPGITDLAVTKGETAATLVVVKVGTDGHVRLRNGAGQLDLLADLAGYDVPGSEGSAFAPRSPLRLLDTRIGKGAPKRPVGPAGALDLQVTGVAGIPANATAVVLNVTSVGATAATDVRAYPTPASGSAVPAVSNLYVRRGVTTANLVVVQIGRAGRVRLRNAAGRTGLLADVAGYYTAAGGAGAAYTPTAPVRVLDTRPGKGNVGARAGRLGNGGTLDLLLGGTHGIPAGATAAVLTVTAVGATRPTDLRAYPTPGTGSVVPNVISLFARAGTTTSNLVVVAIGSRGRVRLRSGAGSTYLLADLAGWYAR